MDFSGKKIAVLGLGIEGKDVVQFLQKQKARKITVFDQKEPAELRKELRELKSFKDLNFKLGKNYLKNGLNEFEVVFRSPAFKLSLPAIREAKKADVIISSAAKLFFDFCPAKIIGVTGTKGKGTTTTLIYKILKRAKKKVFLAGNIGKPMLALLPKLDKNSWVVLELSSFQLQDMEKSPHLAVVLFIVAEHLDYHQNLKEYIQAKANIVRFQKKNDLAVLNADNQISFSFQKLTSARIFHFSRQKKVNGAYVVDNKIYLFGKLIGSTNKLLLRGEHNWENITAAATAANLAGVDLKIIKETIFSFKGLEHRLELVRNFKGVKFYNDSFSTVPETTIAALRSFKEPIILIAGGSEKGSNYTQLSKEIFQSNTKCLILIGQMAVKIKKAVQKAGFKGKIIFRPGKMREIVKTAVENSEAGEVVLFSPACASFDMFKNYKHRGEQFKKYVQAL